MKNNKGRIVLFIIVALILSALVSIDIYFNINRKIIETTNITKTEKEVTITDEGIAESVDKIYDATVIVELMNGNSVIGWGSGFVYKVIGNDAYVITNYHVTDGYDKVRIEFTNGEYTEGKVVGGEEYTDISVVKIDSSKVIKTAEIGKSDNTRLGDTVFAVGTPISMKFKFSVTRGILSGKNRLMTMSSQKNNSFYSRQSVTSESWYINLLQIDASINSGNSGGPLANANGEVIGINNSKLASSDIENIGFAVPIEDVVNVAEQVINDGEVVRPFLGVQLASLEEAKAEGLYDGDTSVKGTFIVSVQENTTMSKAGVKPGDIVTKIGDYSTDDFKYFKYYLYRYKIGDKVTITYLRDGKEHTTEVTLEKKK